MKLFNRNNEKDTILSELVTEIKDLKSEIDKIQESQTELNDKINSINETQTKINKAQKENQEELYNFVDDIKIIENGVKNNLKKIKEEILNINKNLKNTTGKKKHKTQKNTQTKKQEPKSTNTKEMVETKKHLIEVSNSYKRKYVNPQRDGDKDICVGVYRKKLEVDIPKLLWIKNSIPKVVGKTTVDITKYFNMKPHVIMRLIWNIEEGVFDKIFDDYGEGKFHFVKVPISFQKPYGNLKLNGYKIISGENNKPLALSIYDIKKIKKELPELEELTNQELSFRYSLSAPAILRVIWNIEEGVFDGVINEYDTSIYKFENKNNFLYIDDEYTGLTIEKCRVIINCIANDGLTDTVVNNLINTYNNVSSKFIRIICNEYNNVNLNKVVFRGEKKSSKLNFINNPQKRHENGLY